MKFNTLPENIKKEIANLLEHNKFPEAKRLYDQALMQIKNASASRL